ncbi:MAG: hypothetical protein ACI9H8_001972 [Lysobacterales bacterium]|jgi:uncharacterized protein with von Willebrand factor type A (vWA) domain
MRLPERETAVFTTSAIDLFASALGAFILLVMLLFPYYRNAGPREAFDKTQEIMETRRSASSQTQDQMAKQDLLQIELDQLAGANRESKTYISRLKQELSEVKKHLAMIPTNIPSPTQIISPETKPKALTEGAKFSILGLSSQVKSFVLVIDMSGSMLSYEDLMVRSVFEVLEPLDESMQFAIVGYQGNPEPQIWRYPGENRMLSATQENLEQARVYTQTLGRRFEGSTPTDFALQAALDYPASAIILMSDGAPNSPPGYILEKITRLNQIRQTEIHTVAIGDYTHDRNLVMFLQTLSRLNYGDFVGVSH